MADQDKTQAPEDSWVEIEHAGIDGTARVHPRSVPHWEKRGWTAKGRVEAPVNAAPVVQGDGQPDDSSSPARRRS